MGILVWVPILLMMRWMSVSAGLLRVRSVVTRCGWLVMGELIDARRWFAGPVRMSKKQLSLYLERSPRWVELRMREGLPHWYEGRRVWFSRTDVDDWLRGRRAV